MPAAFALAGSAHRAQLAHQPRGAARAGEDADKDFGQPDPRLGVVRDEDAVRGQRQLKTDARGCARQGGGDGLAPLVGLGIHPRAFDLAQQGVHPHRALEETLCRIVARGFLHLGQQVQVHAPREGAVLAAGDDDALHGVVGKRRVDGCVEFLDAIEGHDVHRLARHVPGDDGDAVGVLGHGEIGHVISPDSDHFRRGRSVS
jgi:hypothetical protein